MVLIRDDEGTGSDDEPKTKKVSISDEVEVIGSSETVKDSVPEDEDSHGRRESLKPAKRAHCRMVYVKKGAQNECKQQ